MDETTVDALLEDPQLPLEVLVHDQGHRRVRGTRVVDVTAPRAWLAADVLALTTGVLLTEERDAFRLVEDVVAAQGAGIVFARGAVRDDPPPGLEQACRERGLALLVLPAGVSFARVDEVVAAVTSDAEGYRLRRRLWFQTDLLAVLGEERPLQALMARMAQLVRGTAVLYEGSGRIAASVGDGPVRLLWSELDGRDRSKRALTVGRYHVLAAPVVMRGSGYWLAIASRQERTVADVGAPLLDTAAQMLSAMRGARSLSRAQDQARARSLLTLLAGEVGPEHIRVLWTRLRGHGFTPNASMRAVVARGESAATPRERAELLEDLHERAHLAGVPIVLADESDTSAPEIIALVADEPGLGTWAARLAPEHTVGVSEPVNDLARVAGALRDARMAMQVAQPRTVVWFDDVDLATWLVAGRSQSARAERGRRHFGALLQRPDLAETLLAYLQTHLDISETAAGLFLHPNTVRYRLRRVEDLIGGSLSDPVVLTNLCLFLHVELARAGAAGLMAARPVDGAPTRQDADGHGDVRG